MTESNKETPEQELEKKLQDILSFGKPEYRDSIGMLGVTLPADRFEGIIKSIKDLFATHYKAREAEKIKKSRSFCGCLMCEHHSSAYELRSKDSKS